jgi:ABC-type sulfate/molybdate transport systems ATPase subunit
VALARAVYANADVVLLDDPLAAVDAHVGQHLFDQCIMGLLDQQKCVVLVTNALQFIREATDIVVLDNGCVIEHGNFDELIAQKGNFCDMIDTHAEGMTAADTARAPCAASLEELDASKTETADAPCQTASSVLVDVSECESKDGQASVTARTQRATSAASSVGSMSSSSKYTKELAEKAKKELEDKERGRLINKEDREVSFSYLNW